MTEWEGRGEERGEVGVVRGEVGVVERVGLTC